MKKRCMGVVLVVTGLFTASMAMAADNVHWGYSDGVGPEHWGTLNEKYAICSDGKNQSPINLTAMTKSNLPSLKLDYRPGGNEIFNNGHAIQVNYTPGNTISVDGHEYELKQFHFHAPSENTINGHSYPMEAHFVHADKDGNLAVVALMFRQGAENKELEKAWMLMPEDAGQKRMLSKTVSAAALLPHSYDYYYFNGSLTTPPCSEGVRWFVLKHYVTASKEQIEKFSHVIHHPNNRPVQPLNARRILQ